MTPDGGEARETLRMDAFSDGVFAIAITLLVLELPHPTTGGGVSLSRGLLDAWPSFFALVTSFLTILVLWMNHHNMFTYILRVDPRLMLLNGLLLLFVTLTPFTTALVADHILSEEAEAAAIIYAGTFLLLAFAWNGLWRYASNNHRLLAQAVSPAQVASITKQYYVAPLAYGSALVLSLFSGLAGVAVIFLVAAFYAVTASRARVTGKGDRRAASG